MVLAANVGSDRSWVYSALADFAEGEPKPELLAIRFANTESILFFWSVHLTLKDANKFKDQFEEAKKINKELDANGEKEQEPTKAEETPAKEESK